MMMKDENDVKDDDKTANKLLLDYLHVISPLKVFYMNVRLYVYRTHTIYRSSSIHWTHHETIREVIYQQRKCNYNDTDVAQAIGM